MSFREKYLKYKTKYLQLKNMIGSGEKTAKQYYFGQLNKNYTGARNILVSDRYLKSIITDLETQLPVEKPSDLVGMTIFNQIFDIINSGVNSDYIDLLCKIYLTGQLGQPNSIENKGRLIDNGMLFNKLKPQYRKVNEIVKTLNTFESLEEIETFINSKQEIFRAMEEAKKKKEATSKVQKQLRDEGEEQVIIKLETPNVIVYQPTTEAGAKFYGRNTRWCTAATNDNMFNHYNEFGPIYIIVLKNKFESNGNRIKYQVQLETSQFMNSLDEEVDVIEIIEEVNDEYFTNKFLNMIAYYLNNSDMDENFSELFNKLYNVLPEMPNLNSVIINESVLKILPIFTSIERIIFDDNSKLDDLSRLRDISNLESMSNLKIIFFKGSFNQPLGDSLSGLTSLEELVFDFNFNQYLCDSLSNLTNLQSLDFGISFGFNRPLGDSLSNLINLKNLRFSSNFNHSLDNSLKTLINLENLAFGFYFNKELGDSLVNLINLKSLTFDYSFNKSLGNSLSTLTSLKELTFGFSFNKSLGDSLSTLTNLEKLTLDNNFNQDLGDSLSTLTNLEEIEFGFNFYQPLGDSLRNLTKLKKIIISRGYPYKSTLPNIDIEYR